MLLGHQGASARTDCMYFSIASRVAASSHDNGSHTVRLGTSISASAVLPASSANKYAIKRCKLMVSGS